MGAALDPNVTHLLTYAVIAVLVITAFVGAILVVLGRVRVWLRTAFQEFTESKSFEDTIERLLDRVSEKFTARFEARMTALEQRDVARAKSVTRQHIKMDEFKDQLIELYRMIAELQKKGPTT